MFNEIKNYYKNNFKKWYCSHCKTWHKGEKNIGYIQTGLQSNLYYCDEFIMDIDNAFEWYNLNIKKNWSKFNNAQKMKVANDLFENHDFRRQSNGESIYTKIYKVLRINGDEIYCDAWDEYGSLFITNTKYLFDVFERKYNFKSNRM